VQSVVAGYLDNASTLVSSLRELGYEVFGGVNAPYIWTATPHGMDSWSFFDLLLQQAQLVCTPGRGFGFAGEGYVRLTAFGTPEDTIEAVARLKAL
jgi:LL-diaminopimelate aminotransferase